MTHLPAIFDQTRGCKTGPIGVCETAALRGQNPGAPANALRYIDQYDFGLIAARVRNEGVVPLDMVDAAVDEFRKYCKLVALGYDELPMVSPWVDEIWHAAILHTQEYMAFCQHAFGAYLHHVPNNEQTPIKAGTPDQFFEIYAQEFGVLHPIWQVPHGKYASAQCRVGPSGGCKGKDGPM